MAPLNIHPDESATKKRKNNKALKILLGIGALIAVPAIGSTLAAQITIGGGTAIQFGQGNQVAITCDTTITSTINESWYAASSTFTVATIVLSGVDVRSALSATANDAGCGTKLMTLKLFTGAAGSATPAVIGNGGATSVTFTVPTATTSPITVANSVSNGISGSATVTDNVGVITLNLPSGVVSAADITRVSLETDNPAS